MSKLCDQVIATIKDVFPQFRVKTEELVSYNNQRLFLDIWIPQLNLAVEVHGRQHDEYVEHFHGSEQEFRAAKKRDSIKEEWADINGYTLLVFREADLPISPERFLEVMNDALGDGKG